MYPAIESDAFDLPLMARKRTATLLYSTEEVLTVLEFFAVGDLSTAVLLRAVKGGVRLPQTNISAIFKVLLSFFVFTQFFITHLTLPPSWGPPSLCPEPPVPPFCSRISPGNPGPERRSFHIPGPAAPFPRQ